MGAASVDPRTRHRLVPASDTVGVSRCIALPRLCAVEPGLPHPPPAQRRPALVPVAETHRSGVERADTAYPRVHPAPRSRAAEQGRTGSQGGAQRIGAVRASHARQVDESGDYLPEEGGDIRSRAAGRRRTRVGNCWSCRLIDDAPPRRHVRVSKRGSIGDIELTLPFASSRTKTRADITVARLPVAAVPAAVGSPSMSRFETTEGGRGRAGGNAFPLCGARITGVSTVRTLVWTGPGPPSLTLFGWADRWSSSVMSRLHARRIAELVLDIVAEGDRWFGLDVSSPIEIGPSAASSSVAASRRHDPADGHVWSHAGSSVTPTSCCDNSRTPITTWRCPRRFATRSLILCNAAWTGDRATVSTVATWFATPGRCRGRVRRWRRLSWCWRCSPTRRERIAFGSSESSTRRPSSKGSKPSSIVRGLQEFVRLVVAPLGETLVGGYRLRCYDEKTSRRGIGRDLAGPCGGRRSTSHVDRQRLSDAVARSAKSRRPGDVRARERMARHRADRRGEMAGARWHRVAGIVPPVEAS